MVDKRVVEYIKTHSGRGHSYQSLHDHLVQHGHNSHDVWEAINEARESQHHPHHHKSHKDLSFAKRAFTLLAVIILISAVALIFTSTREEKVYSSVKIQKAVESGAKDCEKDFECFISRATECKPAVISMENTIDIFGLLSTSVMTLEIKGKQGEKCVYSDKAESITIKLGPQLRQQMLSAGATHEEVSAQEAVATQTAQQSVGVEKTCIFNMAELSAMLSRWKEGNFAGGAVCSFNPSGSDCTFTGDFEGKACVVN